MTHDRPYDIVLFGATGFTGGLTAEYLARHAPAGLRWALAGRNPAKLAAVRDRLAAIDPALAELPLLTADVDRRRRRCARSRRAPGCWPPPSARTCTTASRWSPRVPRAGTDYLDITGEPEFVDLMYVRHHAEAVRTGRPAGARLRFRLDPARPGRLVHGPAAAGRTCRSRWTGSSGPAATFSAGTYHSALTAFSRYRGRRSAGGAGPPGGRAPTGRPPGPRGARPAARSAALGMWAVPLPTIDPQVVRRSAAARPEYGPDFRYRHFAAVKRLPTVLLAGGGARRGIVGLVKLPPTRRWLLGRLASGQGPSAAAAGEVAGSGSGSSATAAAAGRHRGLRRRSRLRRDRQDARRVGALPGVDELPATAGQVTPVTAMGDALLDRLVKAGMTFRVLPAQG